MKYKWTKTPPKKNGWYWWKEKEKDIPSIMNIQTVIDPKGAPERIVAVFYSITYFRPLEQFKGYWQPAKKWA